MHRPTVLAILLTTALLALGTRPEQPEAAVGSPENPTATPSATQDSFARHYLEPDAHIALAREQRDAGKPLLAFYTLELARRYRFDQEVFDSAFRRIMLDDPFDNSAEAESRLLASLNREPGSTQVVVKLADVYISRSDWTQAKRYLERAIAAESDLASHVLALAEIRSIEGKAEESRSLLDSFFRRHGSLLEGYLYRLEPLLQDDLAGEQADRLLAEALERYPEAAELHFNRGVLLQSRGDLDAASRSFTSAAELAPDIAYIQGWVGRFFLKAKADKETSLRYYLRAYLLDPHFYETEYAESRISHLHHELAAQEVARLEDQGHKPAELALSDDPLIAMAALGKLLQDWQESSFPILLEALGHEDATVRASAMELLSRKVDRSFDVELRRLLEHPDLRRRGLAAYLAVRLWGDNGVDAIRPMLREEAQLLRFDALSALLEQGGRKACQTALEHRAGEKHSWLQQLLDKARVDGPCSALEDKPPGS